MNLTYVKDFLENRKDGVSKEDVELLINEIKAYQGTEDTFRDISRIMRVVNEYNLSYLTQVSEYDAIPRNDSKLIEKRVAMARAILCTISSLHTYLVLTLSSVKESTYNMKNIRNYLNDLADKREHYKTEKMSWITILKSLTQEMNFIVEMRRLDVEDKVGYLKYARENNG